MYCQRHRTPDIFAELKKTNILVLNIAKDLVSLRKQKDSDYLQCLKALHRSRELELKHLNLVLKYENDLSEKTARSRPKRPSKRARKAIKKYGRLPTSNLSYFSCCSRVPT